MVIGSTLIGYQVSIAHGPSMKPSISNGDALLIRNVDVSQVELGDIVIMKNGTDLIAHRLIQKEDYSYNIFLLKTKGDANTKPEKWYIDHDDKIGSVVMRIPVIGYLLEFLDSTIGKIIVIELILFMMGLYLYQRKCESYTQNNS
jgi:signal peptidase